MKNIFSLLLALLFVSSMTAQVRYIDEVFDDVTVTTNVQYAANITVITTLQGLPPMALPQLMDIYEPAGDTETDRPLMIYMHTGNFLPAYTNGSGLGNKDDSCAVEICTRFAKMGYVVASIDYRLGWNPLAATQSQRTYDLINAAYRGVQDARTAVRYFRMNVAEAGNEYGINPDKIGYFGEGTGGYATLAAATISDYNDIIIDDLGDPILKFYHEIQVGVDMNGDPQMGTVPMVIEAINGDPEGKVDGFAPDVTQLCIGHYPGYSSDVNFQVNLGGALGDLNWLDAGDPAMISFHCPHDPFAPYETNILIVPTTLEPVVSVSGAKHIHDEINLQSAPNNNHVFQSAGLNDALSQEAIASGGYDGLFPVLNHYVDGVPTEPYDSAPWQWWDVATVQAVDAANGTDIAETQLTLNPTMGPVEANQWIDKIQAYTAPRIALILDLITIGPGCTDESACNFNALATTDDGSCTFADEGFDCDGNSLNVEGCMDPLACNYDAAATINSGCSYLSGTSVPTGAENIWLIGLTLAGTPYAGLSSVCEDAGSVNPNVSINGAIVGDGTAPLTVFGANDPTGLLGDLVAVANASTFSVCDGSITISSAGSIIPLSNNGDFWISPIAVNEDGQYLWVAPMFDMPMGCGDPTACNFSGNPCELNMFCEYPGCMDEDADNYDATAGCADPNLCVYLGCTDSTAYNYDSTANTDDGSCIAAVLGCTNPGSSNWNPDANTDDGSCLIPGCTYADADNYDAGANDDDGSCTFTIGSASCMGDLDNDGSIATADLLQFLSVFGTTCD